MFGRNWGGGLGGFKMLMGRDINKEGVSHVLGAMVNRDEKGIRHSLGDESD